MPTTDKDSQPQVSVLLPVYNGEEFLEQSIKSVLRQTYTNWQLLCVDNASTDATSKILKDHKDADNRVTSVRNPSTVSVIENHNVVAKLVPAGAKYCKILHADDALLDSNCLQRMVDLCEANPAVGLVSAWAQQGELTKGAVTPTSDSVFSGREIGQRTLAREIYPFLSPSCVLIRADLVRERPSFYAIDDLHADLDTWLELLKITDFGIVQDTLILVRDHPNSVTQKDAKPLNTLIAAHLEMLVKHGPSFFCEADLAKTLRLRRKHYLEFLSQAWLAGQSAAFWTYHRDRLASLGLALRPGELLANRLLFAAVNPKKTAYILRKRRARNS